MVDIVAVDSIVVIDHYDDNHLMTKDHNLDALMVVLHVEVVDIDQPEDILVVEVAAGIDCADHQFD